MKTIMDFIQNGNITLLAGAPRIGKQTFYLNFLIDIFLNKKVCIINNKNGKNFIINKLNKILYGDNERINKFSNFVIYEHATDIDDVCNLLIKHKDFDLCIIDRINKINGDILTNVDKLRKISIDNDIQLLLVRDTNKNKYFDEFKIEDFKIMLNKVDLVDNTILVDRESYYSKHGDEELLVRLIENKKKGKELKYEFNFIEDYSRLFVSEDDHIDSEIRSSNFDKIAGYDEIKKELLLVKSWIDNRKEIQKKGIDIPKGILLYGPIGTGKTLFAKEFANLFSDATILKIKDDSYRNDDNVKKTFDYARSLKRFVIILIDEFDIFARSAERELLTQLDGLGGDSSNIFVVATCNGYDNLNPALTRRGRLDYIIGLGNPTTEERINLFKYYFEKYGIVGDYDLEYLALITSGENAVNIKAIANETRLRFGEKPSISNIEEMIDKINKRDSEYYGDVEEHDRYLEAVHEVGHAVVAYYHQDFFKFYKATLEVNSLSGGLCKVFPTDYRPGSTERNIADIEISLGGYLACLMLHNHRDRGAISDLERARKQSAQLINDYAYDGFESLINNSPDKTSPNKKRINEKKSEKILAKCEKNVRRIIKENKANIELLARQLVEKKVLTIDDLKRVIA
ncbi:SpoVK/Ycf46/Vps4 family AAA+-type ATPase [Anaeroplasma bactoclasticum]|jgi:ATP-dependent Zn protease|uniref:SpoVK/Ycf46/Vps4 family AAA+-type ATPase n=1 Tax=Anaeroplasma bactoclasticum TaxID=2088 RepID=A0A397RUN3_9MOLU|nr:AAA family ATPase [Anaeroplasma bactoclasticum]RIA77903.1 SpoVK/Ycf46/Vps4 family AAA+-type ATPase [Anaeroplasma bactoclasticum]